MTTKHTVSLWERGGQQPRPDEVFALERVLDLVPGALSRLLGFLPLGARPVRSVPEAISADPQLTPDERDLLLVSYRSLRARRRRGR